MMPKLALLVMIFAVVAVVISVLSKGVAAFNAHQNDQLGGRGNTMQRLSFFLLLALMAYVAATGAS